MSFFTSPFIITWPWIIGYAVALAGLLLAVLFYRQSAITWEMVTKVIATRAYERGRADEKAEQARPIDQRISEAYSRGIRDCHAEWVAAAERHQMPVIRKKVTESEQEGAAA